MNEVTTLEFLLIFLQPANQVESFDFDADLFPSHSIQAWVMVELI